MSSSRRALSGLSATTTTTTTTTRTRTKTRTQRWTTASRRVDDGRQTHTTEAKSSGRNRSSFGNKHQHRLRGKNVDALKPTTTTSDNKIRANEIVQLSSSSNGGIRKSHPSSSSSPYYDESQVFDATSLLFSLIGFDVFFLVGLTVWVRGLKKRYENAIWKIKRLESEKRDLAVAFNLEKADLADPLMNGGGVGRRIAAAAAPTTVPPGGQPPTAGGANDVMLQGLKAERDALKQALKSVQGEMQRYARENVMLENQLEMALLEVEKLTPID
jgi:hypothetical protein